MHIQSRTNIRGKQKGLTAYIYIVQSNPHKKDLPETSTNPADRSPSPETFIFSGEMRKEKQIDDHDHDCCHHQEKRVDQQQRKSKSRLVKYHDLPEYLQNNEFILNYYRCEWPLKDVFLSLFAWHNETLNIWTHLGGFVIFVALTVMSLMEEEAELGGLITNFSRGGGGYSPLITSSSTTMMKLNVSDNSSSTMFPESQLRGISQASVFHVNKGEDHRSIPKWPWFVFLSGAMGCLVCSSLSHLLTCHSKRFNLFFWRLDYAGISLMIVCSTFAPVYYIFHCHPLSRFLYLTSITLLGVLAIITLLSPSLSTPRFRSFRASLFLSMGFSGVIPAAHALILHWGHPHVFIALGYELAMAIMYAIGTWIYVSRVPERWKPGAFDIAGHSHQIFHVFVVLGALAHSAATLVVMDFRRGSPTACVSI